MTDDQAIPHVMPREKWERMSAAAPALRDLGHAAGGASKQFTNLSRALDECRNAQTQPTTRRNLP